MLIQYNKIQNTRPPCAIEREVTAATAWRRCFHHGFVRLVLFSFLTRITQKKLQVYFHEI